MINKEWHAANPMPKRPTDAERLAWHREHQKYCGCRPIPKSLQALLDKEPDSPTS